jgi:Na+-transporting NADH:ubiquinone oxidoreductase subunit NqrB
MKVEINHQRVASIVIISYIPEISISYILWIFANYFRDFIAIGYIIGMIWSIILLVYGIKIATNKEVLPSIGYYIIFQISVFFTTILVAPIFNAIYYGNKLYK